MQLPGAAAMPAVDSRGTRSRTPPAGGSSPWSSEDLRPSTILTRQAFENAIRVNAAIGGSTNAVVHLLAIAGRARRRPVPGGLRRARPPTCRCWSTSCRPGQVPHGGLLLRGRRAGGDGARSPPLLHGDHVTVSGRTRGREHRRRPVLEPRRHRHPGRAVPARRLRHRRAARQSLAPVRRGAEGVRRLRPPAHATGPALVFDRIEDYIAAADDPDLDVDARHRARGPQRRAARLPGLPEVGNVPMPRTAARSRRHGHGADLRRPHERHRLRHLRPARGAGGGRGRPARAGAHRRPDRASTSRRGRLELLVDDAELVQRRAAWRPPPPVADRGWVRLYSEHVLQADQGADLDFLVGGSGSAVPRHSH